MSQPGAMPPSEESSSPKQDRRRRYKHGENELTIEQSKTPIRTPRTAADVERRRSTSLQQQSSIRYGGEVSRDRETASQATLRKAGSPVSVPLVSRSTSSGRVVQAPSPAVARSGQTSQLHPQGAISTSKGKQISQSTDAKATPHSKTDAVSGVKSTVVTGSPQNITAPELQHQGIYVHKNLAESRKTSKGTGNKDRATPIYRIHSKIRDSFKFGNVIELLWVEPTSDATTLTHFVSDVGPSRRRRFVVIREGQHYSAILPISTYGGKGVGAPGVIKAHHAVIFTTPEVPRLLPGEEPTRSDSGVDSLRREIRVKPGDRAQKLDEHSRLNFAKIYQISHAECEIDIFGAVADESMHNLLYQFDLVQQSLLTPYQAARGDELTRNWQGGSQVLGQPGPSYGRADSHRQGAGQVLGQPGPSYGRADSHRQGASQVLGQPGPSHGRVDSVQQPRISQDALKPPDRDETSEDDDDEDGDDGRDNQRRGSQQVGQPSTPPTSTQTLALQLAALNVRARNLGADLANLNNEQRAGLAQRPVPEQTRSLLLILQRQDPERYERTRLEIRRRQIAAAGDPAEQQQDEEDTDEDTDEEDSDEEESE